MIYELDYLIRDNPYFLEAPSKKKELSRMLWELTAFHKEKCEPYRRILNALDTGCPDDGMEALPMLPVRLFKELDLLSISRDEVLKILTSSGTTSQVVSRIYLNKETSMLQTKALSTIVKSFIGSKRLPMIFVDTPGVIKDRNSHSARGAGLLGLSFFGRNHLYLLDENMKIKWDELTEFLDKFQGEKILLFGFTFMVWQYLYEAAVEAGRVLDFGDSVLIHSGGWKKLLEKQVDNITFKNKIREQLGISEIYNFYGMVEQIGSVFMECEEGHLHTPDFADLIVRDPNTLEPVPHGTKGIIQVLSILPRSYPGHSLLTEDLGVILGEDNCPCGRMGKYFAVHGRLPTAELRGCSDTHAYEQGRGQ